MNSRDIIFEIVRFKIGDHVFVVMDRAANSNINDYTTWGENAVIVDAWSGKAFPATKSEVQNNLMDFYRDSENQYNLLRTYNSKFQKMEIKCDNKTKPSVKASSYYLNMRTGKNYISFSLMDWIPTAPISSVVSTLFSTCRKRTRKAANCKYAENPAKKPRVEVKPEQSFAA